MMKRLSKVGIYKNVYLKDESDAQNKDFENARATAETIYKMEQCERVCDIEYSLASPSA